MRAFFSVVIALAVGTAAWATSIRATSIHERTQLSDRVVRVNVLSTETVVPEGDVRRMSTITKVQVLETYKGAAAATIEIFQIGGKSGLWEARVPDDAKLEPNEQAVLFLRCRDPKNPARCTLIGLKTGKLTQITTDELLELPPAGPAMKKRLADVVAEIKRAEAAK